MTQIIDSTYSLATGQQEKLVHTSVLNQCDHQEPSVTADVRPINSSYFDLLGVG